MVKIDIFQNSVSIHFNRIPIYSQEQLNSLKEKQFTPFTTFNTTKIKTLSFCSRPNMTKRPRFNLTSLNIYLWLSPTNPAYANIITKREKSSLPASMCSFLLSSPTAITIIRKAELKKISRLKQPVFTTSDWKWIVKAASERMTMGTQPGERGGQWRQQVGTGLRRIKSICGSNLRPYFLMAFPKSMGNKHCQRVILHTLLINLCWEKRARQNHLQIQTKKKVDYLKVSQLRFLSFGFKVV